MTDWAAKVLAGVPRHNAQDAKSMTGYTSAVWLHEDAVVDAIAKLGAGEGLMERAEKLVALFELTRQTQKPDLGRLDAADTIAALLAHIAALTAKIEELRAERDRRAEMHECAMSERDDATLYADEQKARAEAAEAEAAALTAQNRELALDVLASSGQAQEAYAAQLAAEAEAAALTAQLAEKEEQLVSVLRREAATHERHDAKVARLEALNPNRPNELTDPISVHANMLRGTIAKPTVAQIIHLYGVDALCKALVPVIVQEADVNKTPKCERDLGNVLTESAALRAKVARLEGALTDMPKAVLRTTVCQGPVWPDDRPGVWLSALEACAKSVQAAVDAALTDGGSNE